MKLADLNAPLIGEPFASLRNPLWYEDEAFIRQVQITCSWFLRHYHIPHHPVRVTGHISITNPKDPTKLAIKRVKYLLGYLKPFQLWARGVDHTFINRCHHPSTVGRLAWKRGIRRRHDAIAPDLNTVEGCAKWIINSRVQFWAGLSTGSERIKFHQLAATGKAYCNHTGTYHGVRLNLMQFLVDAIKSTPTMINALNGGDHPYEDSHPGDPRHYSNPTEAADIELSIGSTSARGRAASRHNCRRNSEPDHEHYDSDPAKGAALFGDMHVEVNL